MPGARDANLAAAFEAEWLENTKMQLIWPASLRARLAVLVVICTLPAVAVMSYTAVERYDTARSYAYGISNLAANGVLSRYQDLLSRSRDVLSVMAGLPAVNAPAPACDRALAALRARMPLYANLAVVSLDGEFRCSAVPFTGTFNASHRGWFQRVLATQRFASGVISRGFISHRSLLVFSAPHFDAQSRLIGTLNAVISPEVLEPPTNQTLLTRYGEIALFSRDGTLLMRYPDKGEFVGSDQSHSPLFQALLAASNAQRHSLPGIDGQRRIYSLRRVNTDVPQDALYIASGIGRAVLQKTAFLPLARDLVIVALIAVFIVLCAWWFIGAFVTGGLRPVLRALQYIGTGDLSARTGFGDRRGELGVIARGVDGMAENLQARVADQQLAEQRYAELIEQAVEGVTVRRATGEYVLVNKAFCNMLGYSREQLLHMRITDVIESSEQRGHRLKPGESARFESWMYHKDGHRVFVEASSLRLANGDIQSVQRDIGERIETRRKLEDSERHYRELVEQAIVGILTRRPTGEILFVNEALCRMTGYNRAELVGMHISRLVNASDAEAIRRVGQVTEGETVSFQSRLRHKDGSIIHEELSARRLENGNIQVIINDITARVTAEQRLTDERDFVFHVLDALPGGFYVFNSQGQFLRWNQQLEEITGYGMEEMKRITSADIVPPDRRATHARLVGEILSGADMQGETELYCKDGARIPYYYVARHFHWRGQDCVVGIGVDISARKQAEAHLQEQQQLLSETINSLPGLFSLSTNQGHFLMWNRHLEQLSGYSAEELGNLKPLALIAPEQRALLAKHIAEVFSRGESSVEADFVCRDGRRIPHYFIGRRLTWRGQPCVAGVALDISTRREAEQRAQIYLEELQQLSKRLLDIQEDERRQIARELHDELGQGLSAALLNLEDLASQVSSAGLAAQIDRTSAILVELTQQVRTLSLNMRPSVLDDLGLAAAVRWYLRERVETTGLKVVLDIDKSLPRLAPLIETTCFRVLQSALTNVLRHAQAQRVEVGLQQAGAELVFTLHDDGRGFDVKAARRNALAGKSFGLLGMEERVRLAGGRLEISSNRQDGTRLRITLPLA